MRDAPHRPLDLPAHPRFAGFERFARREIFPWLAAREAERRETVRRFVLLILATVAAIALLQFLAFGVLGMNTGWALILFGVVPAFLGGGVAWNLLRLLRARMKGFLLPKICAQLKLRHVGTAPAFPFDAFRQSGMLPRHDRYTLEDGIQSDESGVVFDAAEARLSVRRRSKHGTKHSTVWRGLLVAGRAPRPFAGLTLVMPERGFVSRLFGSVPAERMTLGLGELEANLEIRSTFPEETRMVLTERVMRRLSELARRLGPERPSLALIGMDVLLAIPTKRNRFETGSLWKPMDEPARIEEMLRELGDLLAVIAALGDALRLERARPRAAEAETSHP